MEKINIKQICNIRRFEKLENEKFVWREYKKGNLFCRERKEGFYYADWYYNGTYFVSEEEILKDGLHYIENHIVYYKPFLRIKMSNGEYFKKYFESVEKMNVFIKYTINPEIILIDVDY